MKTQMQALTEAMTNSIFNVLETMFFLPLAIDGVIRSETLQLRQDDAVLAARLHFSGPLTGYSTFCVPEKIAITITSGFLGADEPGVTKDQILGTVKEIVNMLVGDTFSRFDPQAVFDLDIPEPIDFREAFDSAGPKTENEITIGIRTLEDLLAFQVVIEP